VNPAPNFCDFLEAWLVVNVLRLGWQEVRFRRDTARGTITAGYQHLDCLFSVSGWEKGCCLDIDVLVRSTSSGHIVGAGPCANREVAAERLEAAANWISARGWIKHAFERTRRE
jgi:hypothetical protein